MNAQEARKIWIDALRSGDYEQTRNNLQDENGFCCLGVACLLAEKHAGIHLQRDEEGFIKGKTLKEQRPVAGWLGLNGFIGGYADGNGWLASDNDGGMSFEELADIIESEPEGLFTEGS